MANQQNNFKSNETDLFTSIEGITISRFFPRFSILLLVLLVFFIGCMFLPWVQTSHGAGSVTKLKPEDRMQMITAPVSGRVIRWYVRDGSRVESTDKIVELADIDPYNVDRLHADINAVQERLNSAAAATALANNNYQRQRRLLAQGLTSRKDMEAAQINYNKSVGEQEYYKSLLIKSQSALAKQQNQLLLAERPGYIVNTLDSSGFKIVKAGDTLASFVPDSKNFAVELFISGNDIPLVRIGQHVRLIFDGWPSVQFSGWPSVSIGTFPGLIKVIDYAASSNGLFRVLIVPDEHGISWPNQAYLRMGTQVQGYIQLNKVKLGYELWRQLNGFPVSINNNSSFDLLDSSSLDGRSAKKSSTKVGKD